MTYFERFQAAVVSADLAVMAELLKTHKRYATLSDFNGWTPLHHAAEMAHVEMVKLLLPYYDGVSVNACTYSEYTPFHVMVVAGGYNAEIAALLIDKGAKMETALEKAIYLQDLEKVRDYAVDAEQINKADAYGNSPLHNAIAIDAEAIFDVLLAANADIECVDLYRTTPLHAAAADARPWALDALLEKGALLEKVDYNKRTALHFAAGNAFKYGVEKLIASGALLDVQDSFGNTPLHYAYENSELEIVQLLINSGANVYLRNDDGMPAEELFPEGE
ncbi:MAG: ankyrin repeat domain-containing protein [Marinifilaceae bacterium]